MTPRPWHLPVGALLLWGVAMATVCAGVPAPYAPFSLTVTIPVMLVEGIGGGFIGMLLLGAFPIPALFLVSGVPLVAGKERIPRTMAVVAGVLVALSLYYLVKGWPYGLQYHGALFTVAVDLYNSGGHDALSPAGRAAARGTSISDQGESGIPPPQCSKCPECPAG